MLVLTSQLSHGDNFVTRQLSQVRFSFDDTYVVSCGKIDRLAARRKPTFGFELDTFRFLIGADTTMLI